MVVTNTYRSMYKMDLFAQGSTLIPKITKRNIRDESPREVVYRVSKNNDHRETMIKIPSTIVLVQILTKTVYLEKKS